MDFENFPAELMSQGSMVIPDTILMILLTIFILIFSLDIVYICARQVYIALTYQNDCDLIFETSFCSMFRRVALTCFVGVTSTQFCQMLERLIATVLEEKYEFQTQWLGGLFILFSVLSAILAIEWALWNENPLEPMTHCLTYSTSASIGERMYMVLYGILFADLFILVAFFALWRKNKQKVLMEPGSGSPLTARAKFMFEGTNNDELSFDKDAVITITQKLDDGWWEGTHEGVTGWFPSGYVTLLTEKEIVAIGAQPDYREAVLKSFIEAEKEYMQKLLKTLQTLLLPIGKSKVLSASDYCTLVGNYEDIFTLKRDILESLEREQSEDLPKMKVGGVFMKAALELRTSLSLYADNHPDAVEVLKKKQKDLEKVVKAQDREYKDLVSGLSEPLRHVDKYYNLLQELERIVPANHPDRGDLQRGAAVFRETKDLCETLRKQKEAQLDFLFVSKVDKVVSPADRGTILFVALFTKYIMFFEVTKDMTYDIKEKYPVSGFIVHKKNATEIVFDRPNTGEFTLTMVASGGEVERFMMALGKAGNVTVIPAPSCTILRRPSKNTMDNMSQSQGMESPLTSKPPLHPMGISDSGLTTKRKSSSKNFDDVMNLSNLKLDHELGMVLPEGFELPTSSRNSRNNTDNLQFSQFPAYFLSGNSGKRSERGFRLRKDAARDEEIEFETLRILEGYCVETSGAQSDFHANESYQQPHLIVAEDEKILMEEMVGDEMVLQEKLFSPFLGVWGSAAKSIVDAVYSLKDHVMVLQADLKSLQKAFESEQKARRRLEHMLPKMSGVISPDGSSSTPRKEINSFDS
ncbi:Protein CBR-PIX-1 [Caenorhabditis briggsae]|uniref:Protein CBR-PIX-1 n=1 Tax=Caenorhabditis briggsae TaxID=6238 RepID=A8X4W5_CAEBR|nr:Protein CBR-PIX-1 [Caenorhabditis briggsae]CAP27675.1 Protein CBR-PIX-1 [Caenorhabditis briggsae]